MKPASATAAIAASSIGAEDSASSRDGRPRTAESEVRKINGGALMRRDVCGDSVAAAAYPPGTIPPPTALGQIPQAFANSTQEGGALPALWQPVTMSTNGPALPKPSDGCIGSLGDSAARRLPVAAGREQTAVNRGRCLVDDATVSTHERQPGRSKRQRTGIAPALQRTISQVDDQAIRSRQLAVPPAVDDDERRGLLAGRNRSPSRRADRSCCAATKRGSARSLDWQHPADGRHGRGGHEEGTASWWH